MPRKAKSKKSKKTKKSQKKVKINKSKVVADLVAGNNPQIPKGKIFNLNSGKLGQEKTYLTKQRKLRKRLQEVGYTFNKKTNVIMPPANVTQRISAGFKMYFTNNKTGEKGSHVMVKNVKFEPGWQEKLRQGAFKSFATKYDLTLDRVVELEDVKFIAPSLNMPSLSLPNIRMKRASPLIIDGFQEQGWNKKIDQCVKDFLLSYYGGPKDPNFLAWEEAFNEFFWPTWKTDGVCALELENFAKACDIDMIALDIDFNVVLHHKAVKNSRKMKSLIYVIKDEHMHPIVDNNLKMSIQKKLTNSTLFRGVTKKIKEKIQEREKTKETIPTRIVKIEDETSITYLCREMLKTGKQPLNSNINYGISGVNSYILDNEQVVFETHENKAVIDYFKSIDKPYQGQTLGKFATDGMDNMKIVKSTFNPVVREILNTEGVKNIVHRGLFQDSREMITYEEAQNINNENYLTFDINKCHSHIIKEEIKEWLVGDYNDEVKDYTPCQVIAPGLYFVNTDDVKLFNKSGWYSHEIVSFGLDNELINHQNIEKQITMGYVDGGYFEKLFKEEYPQLLENTETPEAKRLLKAINNATSGMLGKTHKHKFKKILTSSPLEAQKFILDNNDRDLFFENINIEHEGENHNFIYAGYKEKIPLDKHNLPMYIQILCNVNILMYKHMIDATADKIQDVIYRNIDSFTIKRDKRISKETYRKMLHTPNVEGELKMEKNPTKFLHMPSKHVIIDWEKYNFGWIKNNDITSSLQIDNFMDYVRNAKSALVQGEPGTGKSHIIKGLSAKNSGIKCLKITGSNVSARNIKGHTIHSVFGYDGENINRSKISKIKDEEYDLIIIDEYQILKGELWNVIYEVWQDCKLPILAFGDMWQLKPVKENEHYFNNSMVKQMLGCNLIQLEYNHKSRLDKKLIAITRSFRTDRPVNYNDIYCQFKKITDPSELPFFNICYTNHYRIKYNKIINKNNYFKSKHMELKTDNPEWIGVNMHLEIPIMCIDNLYQENFYNGERYIVIGWNDEKVFLNNDEEITIDKMLKHFIPAYMMTNHKIIGITCEENYTIHEYNNNRLDNNWHCVVLSRARDFEQISCFEE